MRKTRWEFVGAISLVAAGWAQQPIALPAPSGTQASAAPQAAPERVKLFNGAPGLMAPLLLPPLTPNPPKNRCNGLKRSGSVTFSFIVDSEGRPRNIVFEHVTGNELDYLAVHVMETDVFKPATLNGAAVAGAGMLDMRLQACSETTKDQRGHKSTTIRLVSAPDQKIELPRDPQDEAALAPISDPETLLARIEQIGGSVTRPKRIFSPQMEGPDDRPMPPGSDKFSMVVDEHGLPYDVQAVSPIESYNFDEATRMVRRFRYRPARKDGMPVPVRISIEIGVVVRYD
jgi:hypothetical protein